MPYFPGQRSVSVTIRGSGAQQAVTCPAAVTEWISGSTSARTPINLGDFRQIRVGAQVNTACSAGSKLALQVAGPGLTGWEYVDDVSGPFVTINAFGAAWGSWVDIQQGARGDVTIRPIFRDGDGATSGNIANIIMELR